MTAASFIFSKFYFQMRSKMLRFRHNYKNQYSPGSQEIQDKLLCPLCEVHQDEQELFLTCTKLKTDRVDFQYQELFSKKDYELLSDRLKVTNELWNEREKYLEEKMLHSQDVQ